MTDPTAQELIAQAGADPTLDELLRRDPRRLTDEDYLALSRRLREQRVMIQEAEKAKEKKEKDDDGSV